MRYIATTIIGLTLLTGCASTETASDSTPTITVTSTPEPTPVTASDDYSSSTESEMLTIVRAKDSYFDTQSDSLTIEVAHQMCGALRGGATVYDIGQVADDTIGQAHAAVLLAGAIIYLCPDQQSKIGG